MKVLITGTRRALVAEDVRVIDYALQEAANSIDAIHVLVHGGAKGVDLAAASLCKDNDDILIVEHKAEWTKYGKGAGPHRNQKMLDLHPDIDVVLAFPARESRGTWDMVERAVKAHLPVRVYPLWGRYYR